jgi:glutamyl-tRNA synthetase
MKIVTRFAPSPTGFLHIGNARTALFNWLYTRHVGGTFRLRIEDTDRARSTPEAIQAIFDGLAFLEIDWDGETVFQFSRMTRHAEIAKEMVAKGHAYYAFETPDELARMREAQKAAGKSIRYEGHWRERDPKDAPPGINPVVRLKAPTSGETIVEDLVQGTVRVANEQLDDMVLLRADGTPTYMLSVVVDDHDMDVTHIIRGDDHLTNAFRQSQIYKAMGWEIPRFAHIPLIHGADGAKLSKRHGALGVAEYRKMGFLPAAMRNYLLRLGWGHGDVDIISTADAVKLFELSDIGRSPSRFDLAKLTNMNGHYIRAGDDAALVAAAEPFIDEKLDRALTPAQRERLARGMAGLKQRAKTLIELADAALFYCRERPIPMADKARALLEGAGREHVRALTQAFAALGEWTEAALEAAMRAYIESRAAKMGDVAQPLRAALTGQPQSPGLFEVMAALGRDEALGRRADAAK